MTKRVLITGADGFIGQNLQLALRARADISILCFGRGDDPATLAARLSAADWVVHLAGVNRSDDDSDFAAGNTTLTQQLAEAVVCEVRSSGRSISVIYASSTQAAVDNVYGLSKRHAEDALRSAGSAAGFPTHIFRLPNVFGKWARPNYNSAVATFCHNIARDLPIVIHDPDAALTLAYVDDVVAMFIALIDGRPSADDVDGFCAITPVYRTTVGALAETLRGFRRLRDSSLIDRVGTGLVRALYATYVSYLPPADFHYPLVMHDDPRGRFVEMLRTPDCGQFSYFTAHPGVTRGGHYHHSKTEKFLVIAGTARFGFRHMLTQETHTLVTTGAAAQVVDTVPGWTHDITNIGTDQLVVMLWANEVFDPAVPDTYACPVDPPVETRARSAG